MRININKFKDFYNSKLGGITRETINRKVCLLWPPVKDENILGLGYATPYLSNFRSNCPRVVAATPVRQEKFKWTFNELNLKTLFYELNLPFSDLSIDKILIIHAVESAKKINLILREAWGTLKGNGRIILIVQNYPSLSALFKHISFGWDSSYSVRQISKLLEINMSQSEQNLFQPLRMFSLLKQLRKFMLPNPLRSLLSNNLKLDSLKILGD